MFEPRLDPLPPAQRRLWPELSVVPPEFILYGGTALALRLGLTLRRVEDPEKSSGNGLLIASLLDLAATKVKVVQDRAELKDYLDIVHLLEAGIDLGLGLGAARAVYGPSFNPLLSLKALSYFDDGDLRTFPDRYRTRLVAAVARVDPLHLPEITPLPGGLVP